MQVDNLVPLIQPAELYSLLSAHKSVCILDVRQTEEFELVHIPGSALIPLMELPARIEEVRELASKDYADYVVVCRVGGRSEQAVRFLRENGIEQFKNLRGGINAYAKEGDTTLSPY